MVMGDFEPSTALVQLLFDMVIIHLQVPHQRGLTTSRRALLGVPNLVACRCPHTLYAYHAGGNLRGLFQA